MAQPFSDVGLQIIADAARLARENRHSEISTGHILLAIAQTATVGAEVLAENGATQDKILDRLRGRKSASADPSAARESQDAAVAIARAAGEARTRRDATIGPDHLLLAVLGQANTATRILRDLGVSVERVRGSLYDRLATARERNVFIVHGRDEQARQAVLDFLHALDLMPQEWPQLSDGTADFFGETVAQGFGNVQATIVLLTPDDVARTHRAMIGARGNSRTETRFVGQARQNVVFEAGMALALMPKRTIFVQIGRVRRWSDIAGRDIVYLRTDPVETSARLQDIVLRLKQAGCQVDDTGHDWLRPDRFTRLSAHRRRPRRWLFG